MQFIRRQREANHRAIACPAGPRDRHAERIFFRLLIQLTTIGCCALAKLVCERLLHLRQHLRDCARRLCEACIDGRPHLGNSGGVALLARRHEQLDGRGQLFLFHIAAGGVAEAEQIRLAALLEIPDFHGRRKAFLREFITIATQRSTRSRQRCRRAVVQRRGRCRERPSIVLGRVRTRWLVDASVGLGHRIAQMRVLPEIRLDDARYGMAEHSMLSDQHQHAVLDLLHQVRRAIRTMQLHVAARLVDRCFIARGTELLPDVHQRTHRRIVRLRAQIEITGVVPAADVQARNVLTRLER